MTLPLVLLFYLTGTVLFGYYRAYPGREPVVDRRRPGHRPRGGRPRRGRQAAGGGQQNRILPFYVVHQLPSPLPGILIAAVFGATIAVVSAGINALATAALMDFGGEPRREPAVGVLPVPAGSRIDRPLRGDDDGARAGDRAARDARRGLREDLRRVRRPAPGDLLPGRLHERANGHGALIGGIGGAVAGLIVAFSEYLLPWNISMMWIPATATAVTFLLGLAGQPGIPRPGPEIEGLVFHGGRKPKADRITA